MNLQTKPTEVIFGKIKNHYTKKRWMRILLVVAVVTGFCYWSNNSIQVTHIDYESDQLPESFDGCCIVQVSDLHNKKYALNNRALLKAINAETPDYLMLTGDFVDGKSHTNFDNALYTMEQLTEIAPCYYIAGNHEAGLKQKGLSEYLAKVKEMGVRYLCNEQVLLTSAAGEQIHLVGMYNDSLQGTTLANLVAKDDASVFHLVLAHEPQFFADYAETGVDLILSGHAHGGQFRIPFTHQGLYAPDEGVLPKYGEGVHEIGGSTMIISRGLGNSIFPQRLFNRPELVSITLHSSKAV